MRRALFLASAAALVALLALLSADHRPSPTAPAPSSGLPGPRAPAIAPSSPPAAGPPAVGRFLLAYLAYEEGDRSAAAQVRASSAPSLAREILSSHPQRGRTASGQAGISGLTVTSLPARPDLAIATGAAERRSGSEPFAFLFARREGSWLAVAPAE